MTPDSGRSPSSRFNPPEPGSHDDKSQTRWNPDPAEEIEREELLNIIRMLPDVIFRCEKRNDGKIYWTLNEGQLATQFHLTTKEIQGKSLEELFPGGASDEIKRHFEAAFQGETEEFVNELGGRYFKHHPQPVYDDAGNVIAVVGFITEVTELTLAEREVRQLSDQLARRVEELSQANQELEMYNHMLAHDLNNSISVIKMQCQIASKNLHAQGAEKAVQAVSKIDRSAGRMNGLLEDFLKLSLATRGPLERREVDLTDLGREVANEVSQASPRTNGKVSVQAGLKASADPALLRVLLENLIGNAWKYTQNQAETRIDVDAAVRPDGRWYRVRDNGIGFTPHEAAKLFEPLYRTQDARKFPGTGIGLATAARIVERHGGEIRARGEPGQGASFWFTLPDE